MNLAAALRNRWVRWPIQGLAILVIAAGGILAYRLTATAPGMYASVGVAEPDRCSVDADPSEAIVYTSLRPGNLDLYLFEELEGVPRRLTNHPNLDYNPVLSPDGRWVVFASDRDGATNLYALELEGDGEPIRLTSHPAMDNAPAFSPDGSILAFVSTRQGKPDIHLMPFAPGDPGAEEGAVNLTDHPYGDFNPAFSPDGSLVAFSSNRTIFRRWNPMRLLPGASAMTHVWVMNQDGSDVRRVSRGMGIAGSPAWTEDGSALLYYRATGPDASAVYRTPLRGRGTVRLSPEDMAAFTPTAGPGGSVIFVGFDGRDAEAGPAALQPSGGRLYRVEADGTGLTPLSPAGTTYLKPRLHLASERLVAYGDGPVPEPLRMANGTPFTWPGAVRTVALPDRCVRLHAVRAYFPSFAVGSDRVVSVSWVHEANGIPPGPSPIISAALDGSDLETVLPPTEGGFMWGPVTTRDGEWILYSAGPRFGDADEDVGIWKVRGDGTGATLLTADSRANDAFPDVSADGGSVVFRSGRDAPAGSGRRGDKEIYLMNGEGGEVRRITRAGGVNTMPAISPDGQWVVFSTTRTGKGWKLWIQSLVDPEDEGRPLEPARAGLGGRDMHPRFSPDGRWVVFTSDRAGFMDEIGLSGLFPQPYGELFAVPVDGSGPAIRLTHDKWEDGLPFWGSTGPTAAR